MGKISVAVEPSVAGKVRQTGLNSGQHVKERTESDWQESAEDFLTMVNALVFFQALVFCQIVLVVY